MFTRQPAGGRGLADITKLDRTPDGRAAAPMEVSEGAGDGRSPPPMPDRGSVRGKDAGDRSYSIIGNDLTIVGQGLRIITRGTLQVDGLVEGDVVGNEVIIGEKGRVTGVVSGESVEVRGAVAGTVKAMSVCLRASAKVSGDVHHRELTVEQGAHLDGRVRRPEDTAELNPVFE
jgi:cytoskeletal protein CcmA (bactofilin family)